MRRCRPPPLTAPIFPGHPQPVHAQMLLHASIIFCMTEEQADDLADANPRYDAKIYALGEKDIQLPGSEEEYKKAAKK